MLPEHLACIPTVHKQSNRPLLTLGKPARPTQTQNIATQRCSPQLNKSVTSHAPPSGGCDDSSPVGNQHTHPSKTGRRSALGQQVPESP